MAMAGVKRDKNEAKKKARLGGFSYMDQLFDDQPCMTKPVNVMTYDMKPFLQSCIDRYVALAGRDAKPLKIVSTPFHEERIARPVQDEKENERGTGANSGKGTDENSVRSKNGPL